MPGSEVMSTRFSSKEGQPCGRVGDRRSEAVRKKRDRAAQNALASGSPGHFITVNELTKAVEAKKATAG
jgi:hypothetical protein